MPQIIITWFLFTAICLLLGRRLELLIIRFMPEKQPSSLWLLYWTGMSVLYILLSFITFFFPLSPLVKSVVWIAALGYGLASKDIVPSLYKRIKVRLKNTGLAAGSLFILTAGIGLLKAAGVPEIFDEGAYHLPLIRMWEGRGIIPGYANLNAHYGLHSGWHLLSAFSNLSFLPGFVSEMSLNGLLAAITGLFAASRLRMLLKGETRISAFIAILLPFFLFRNLLSSPSTDVPAIIGLWFFFILWLEKIEKKQEMQKTPELMLLLPVFLVVLKASSAGILLVVLFFLISGFQNKKLPFIPLLAAILCGGIWVLQNWLISGYAFFPLSFSAIGHPEWQVPAESIQKKFYLEQFGAFAPPANYSFSWLRTWFGAHNPDTRIVLLLSAFFFLLFPLLLWLRKKKPEFSSGIIPFTVILFLLSSVWFFTITEPRYGFGSLIISALFPLAYGYKKLAERHARARWILLAMLPLMALNLMKTYGEFSGKDAWLQPSGVPEVQYRKLRCGNFSAACPEKYSSPVPEGKPVFCWDCPLPCFPKEGISDSAFVFRKKIAWFTTYNYQNPFLQKKQNP